MEYALYILTTQAQLDFLKTANWTGTFGRVWLERNTDIRREYAIGMRGEAFYWKIAELERVRLGSSAKSKSPDTWLRKPYKPGVTPLSLP